MKKIWLILIVIILILSVRLIINNNKNKDNNLEQQEIGQEENTNEEKVIPEDYVKSEDGNYKNQSDKMKEEKEINGIVFSNIRLTGNDKESVFSIDLYNTTKKTIEEKKITLLMKNKKNEEVGKLGFSIPKMEADKHVAKEMKLPQVFINTYDFEILDKELILDEESTVDEQSTVD